MDRTSATQLLVGLRGLEMCNRRFHSSVRGVGDPHGVEASIADASRWSSSAALLVVLLMGCHDQQVSLVEEPVTGDLAPRTLVPGPNNVSRVSPESYGSHPLTSDRAFAAAAQLEPLFSSSVTYRIRISRSSPSFVIPVESAASVIFDVRSTDDTNNDWALLDTVSVLDDQNNLLPSPKELGRDSATPSLELGTQSRRRLFVVQNATASNYTLTLAPETAEAELIVNVRYPKTRAILGATLLAPYYQPGDKAGVEFEATSSLGGVEVDDAVLEVVAADGTRLPIGTVSLASSRGGFIDFQIPSDTPSNAMALHLSVKGRDRKGSFRRSLGLTVALVRPHAEIVDLRTRVNRDSRIESFEVDATIRSLNGDRFRLEGTLTGRSDVGYELPVAKAFVEFGMLDPGLESAPLVFDLSSVQAARVGGPFVLRDLTLTSQYTGQVQHRIGLVDGVETPLRWGLAGNKELSQTLCLLLADSGRILRSECEVQ